MKIGVDVDEVLADLFDKLMDYHNEKYGTSFSRKDHTQGFALNTLWGGTWEQAKQKVLDFYESPHFKRIVPVPGSVEGITELHKDHELFAITARPLYMTDETKEWIEKHFSNKIKEIHLTNTVGFENLKSISKSSVCQKLGVDLMIDDHSSYTNDCASKGIPALLINNPWNAKDELHPKVTRVNSWKEIVEHIKNLNGNTE